MHCLLMQEEVKQTFAQSRQLIHENDVTSSLLQAAILPAFSERQLNTVFHVNVVDFGYAKKNVFEKVNSFPDS